MARCLAHDDQEPGLSIGEINGKVLVRYREGLLARRHDATIVR